MNSILFELKAKQHICAGLRKAQLRTKKREKKKKKLNVLRIFSSLDMSINQEVKLQFWGSSHCGVSLSLLVSPWSRVVVFVWLIDQLKKLIYPKRILETITLSKTFQLRILTKL